MRTLYWLGAVAIIYVVWMQCRPWPNLASMQAHPLAGNEYVQQVGQDQITELALYEGQFRVLGVEHYIFGREAKYSPLDLAVGWDKMADPAIYSQVKISQSGRWYYWQVESPPISLQDIASESANMHIIPANSLIAHQLRQVKRGDLINLKGALVQIKSADGWVWKSSLSRTDTGAGACELMRVDQMYVVSSAP